MRLIKWVVVILLIIHIVVLFLPWVEVPSKDVVIGGFHSEGTNAYGKPGLFHLILLSLFTVFLFMNRVWSKRIAFFLGALNIAWAVKNYSMISACSGGICPEKFLAIYLLLFSSILLFVTALFYEK